MRNWVTKSGNGLWVTWLIILFYVISMTCFFPKAWADTPQASSLIDTVSSVVPMIRYLQKIPIYNNFWGVFYAFFWIMAPIFPILGFVSTFSPSKKELGALREKSGLKLIFAFLTLFAGDLFLFSIPDAGTMPWFNELSSNVIVLLFTCLSISGCLCALGLFAGMIRIKLSKNFA